MQFRHTLVAAAISALAACEAPPAPSDAQPAAAARPAAAEPAYVGLWAVSEAVCADPAWRFSAHELATQGEVHCAFNRVTPRPGGYTIEAMCTAEAPPAPYEIGLEFNEDQRAMSVSGGPWMSPTRLVWCAAAPDENGR